MRFIPGPSRRGSVRLRVGLTTLAASTLFGALGATSRPLDAVLRNGPGVVNHPVGVRPSAGVRVPPGWPLASDGTLTCKTCHSRLPEISGASDAYLRDSQTGAAPSMHFCAKCHEADTAMLRRRPTGWRSQRRTSCPTTANRFDQGARRTASHDAAWTATTGSRRRRPITPRARWPGPVATS